MEDNALVVKHNQLVQARYKLNPVEQKIILYGVSRIDTQQEVFNIIQIKVADFSNLINSKGSTSRYSEIEKIVKNLMSKQVKIKTDSEDLCANWVSSIKYIKKTGVIELEFSVQLMPYLLQLKDNFTKYEFKNILYLKKKYSIRLYELLKQYENMKNRKNGKRFRYFKLDELRALIGCTGKSYEKYKVFKQKILEPVRKELELCTDITYEYEPKREGGSTVGIFIYFDVEKTEQQQMNELLKSVNYELLENIKEKLTLKDIKINDFQLMELYTKADSMANGLDTITYLKIAFSKLDSRKKDKEQAKIISDFDYTMKILENLSKM